MLLPWKMSLAGGEGVAGRAEDVGLQREYESTAKRNKERGITERKEDEVGIAFC